jgi:hypothetical protein
MIHSFYYIPYQPKGVPSPRNNFSGTGGISLIKVSYFKMSFWCDCFDQKTNKIFLRISALASKKRLNQKLYYTKYDK